MTRTFKIGHHIWFVLYYDNAGNIDALEEHDWREGGGVRLPAGNTWEEYFISLVNDRVTNDPTGEAEKLARAFLASDEQEVTIFTGRI
jgi:hypothetical protein